MKKTKRLVPYSENVRTAHISCIKTVSKMCVDKHGIAPYSVSAMKRDTGTQQRDEELDALNREVLVKHGYARCHACRRISRKLGSCNVCDTSYCEGRGRCARRLAREGACLCDVAAMRRARVAASGLKLVRKA
jgi:hypothetical protein